MLKIYGSMLCPDCVDCRRDLDNAGVAYEYLDITESLIHLKAFLKLRDTHPVFSELRGQERIGIPCLVDKNGIVTLDWSGYVGQGKP